MFSVDIRVNGTLVAHVYGCNDTKAGSPEMEPDSYHCEYYEPERKRLACFNVRHKRDDGIAMLVVKILEKAERIKK